MSAMAQLDAEITTAKKWLEDSDFRDYLRCNFRPLAKGEEAPCDALEVRGRFYRLDDVCAAWDCYGEQEAEREEENDWIDALPPIGAPPIRRPYRITYHENGRLISMSPALETIGDIAVAIHNQRAYNPMPGEYRVWRIAEGGKTARLMGNPPAYYPEPVPA
jgi:hypothetical protein